MPYQDNQNSNIYGGERYNEAHVPDVRAPRMAQAVSNELVMRGIAAMGRNIEQFGSVLQSRYKNKRDNENQLALQEIDAERRRELDRRFQLPNGAEGGFYDKDGQLDMRAIKQFNDEYMKRARKTNTGYATPWDKEERDMYLQGYEAKCTQETEAAAVASIQKRGMQAFEDSYQLYTAQGDYGSAAAAAQKAYQDKLISEDKMKYYCLRAEKSAAAASAKNIQQSGEPQDLYNFLEKNKDMFTPEQYEALLGGMQEIQAEKTMAAIAGGDWLSAKEAGYDNQFIYTERALEIANAKAEGMDMADDIIEAMTDEARSLKNEEYNDAARKNRFFMQWKSLGASADQVNKAWSEAEEIRKGLKTPNLNERECRQVAKSALAPGHLGQTEEKLLEKTLYYTNHKGEKKVQPRWGKDGEARAYYAEYAGIKPDDSDEEAAQKYYARKTKDIQERNLNNAFTDFRVWRDTTEEGKKANMTAQRMYLEDKIKQYTGQSITLGDTAQADRLYGKNITRQNIVNREWQEQRGGRYIVQPKQIRGTTRIAIDNDEAKEPGILMPRIYEGELDLDKDGVLLTDKAGRCAAVKIVGFTENDEPVMTRAMAARASINPQAIPTLKYEVQRGASFTRARGIQIAKGAKRVLKEAQAAVKEAKKNKSKKSK